MVYQLYGNEVFVKIKVFLQFWFSENLLAWTLYYLELLNWSRLDFQPYAHHDASMTEIILLHLIGLQCKLVQVINIILCLTDYLEEPSPMLEKITFVTPYGTSTWNMNSISRDGIFLHKVTSKLWGFQQRSCIFIMISMLGSKFLQNVEVTSAAMHVILNLSLLTL